MVEATATIWEEIRLRYLRGGSGAPSQRRFTARADNLWRLTQGSNAAVLKKIHNGGTHSRKQLGNQLDYLFSKAEAVFGNMVDHDPDGRTLSRDDRKTIVNDWEDGWRGQPKNGHTTHLLLSFPADVAPDRARQVAEIWAAEMFQSGTHVDDEWAYVAALHTDRSHPHVHIVVNNRGLAHDSWFYMAKGHGFELIAMKERMVEIAAEQGLYLDSSSRIDRGKLTYGPSRAELENALREGRDVYEKPLRGLAMRDALTQIGENIATLQICASMARQSSDAELAGRISAMAETLSRGGIISMTKEDQMQAEAVRTRGDLAQYYDQWLGRAEVNINRLPTAERGGMRRELYAAAAEVAKQLGDARGAELMRQPARDPLHAARIGEQAITRGEVSRDVGPDGIAEIRDRIGDAARRAGLDPERVQGRLNHGAANAWQERDWTKQDLIEVARSKKLDLDSAAGRSKAATLVDGFYAQAGEILSQGLERSTGNDRLTRTLGTMAQALKQDGQVAFQNEAHARRFARDLKDRYGADLMVRLARGDDRALAVDIPDRDQRRAVAQAITAAAERHETMGMSLRQVQEAKLRLREERDRTADRDGDHPRGRDKDRER